MLIMAKTIAIATHKGGTGKTVTAMALGAGFARAGKKTLLIDLDPQGHCSLGLGVDLDEKELTLRDFFSEPSAFPLKRVIRGTHLPNLFIAPATIRLAPVSQSLYMRTKREEILKKGLMPIQKEYDYILVDCPPTLGVLTEAGIEGADLIIVPCRMDARAADGLVDLLDVIFTLKGENFDNYRILITQYDSRKSVTNEAVMTQLAPWKDNFFETFIPQSEQLNQAQMERTDVFSFDAKGRGALAYEELTKEILNHDIK
jgi:chromosome partitioning protein